MLAFMLYEAHFAIVFSSVSACVLLLYVHFKVDSIVLKLNSLFFLCQAYQKGGK